jgi:membrane-associated protease RseP (regulator of RpoE activity)
MLEILQVILVLALLIFVHELGHFLAARLQGIYANRFSIGFGPVIWKYQGKQTEYALRALPLGGFVGFPDEDPDSDISPNDPNLMKNRPVMDRAIVISAGVIANLIFAYFVLLTQAGFLGTPSFSYDAGVRIAPGPNSIAEKAGIKAGDLVLAVDGQVLQANQEALNLLKQTISNSAEQSVKLLIQREAEEITIAVTPDRQKDDKGNPVGRIGIGLAPNGKPAFERVKNIGEVFTVAASQLQNITIRTFQGFGQLVTNFGQTSNQVAGPVAIVSEGAKIAKANPANLFNFAALISINLAVMNILPLPALDGGQLIFLLFEAVFRRPVSKRLQEGFMQIGLVSLLGLGVFLIIRDTANLLPK